MSLWSAEDGAVAFRNLAPGEYRILAWEDVDERFVAIPEFRDRFDAQIVRVTEGSRKNIEAKVISKSASDGEIAKLQ